MTKRLENQVAWVSGAASGMGQAIARLFIQEGAAVAMVDVQEDKGRVVAEQITREGGRAVFIPCDVTKEEQVEASIDGAVRQFGGLHILVNNAGIVQVKLLHEVTEAEFDRVMNVNVKSIFFSVKHGIEHLRKNRRSYVVNVG